MYKPSKNEIRFVAIILLIFIIMGGVGIYQGHRNTLPQQLDTLAKFERAMPKPVAISLVHKAGYSYIVVQGPLAGAALASGPPLYIFDMDGHIVDGTEDVGDDGRFKEKWGWVSHTPTSTISLQQALQAVNSRQRLNQTHPVPKL